MGGIHTFTSTIHSNPGRRDCCCRDVSDWVIGQMDLAVHELKCAHILQVPYCVHEHAVFSRVFSRGPNTCVNTCVQLGGGCVHTVGSECQSVWPTEEARRARGGIGAVWHDAATSMDIEVHYA